MKYLKKWLSATLATTMLITSVAFNPVSVYAAPSISAGWNECLYAEWADSNPDSATVKVGYKPTGSANYTYLEGNDLEFLVRKAETSGYGRVDIPGLKEGRYDIEITASDGAVHTRTGIKVYGYDRSGYAHWQYSTGIGAYNNDGTLKSDAIVVYVTDENKDTVEVPGYEGHAVVNYASSSSGATWTRETAGIGNILNNNHKYIREITNGTMPDGSVSPKGAHPIVFRFIGNITPPKNLTPYNAKTNELGGSKGDNGNLAITKYAKNITLEGIGADATINGWGFTFSQTSTCPADAGESFEVRNLTFKNYPEDALGFQGDDGRTTPIRRVWVHNNIFYPGYCANPTASDKSEGDGSCDFKRGQNFTMSYNHFIKCHKTNLLGKGAGDEQFNVTYHHNWYEDVASRQPLAADGNVHIYNTYFQDTGSSKKHNTSQIIDLRGSAHTFSESNYFDNCKNTYSTRNATSYLKIFNDMLVADSFVDKEMKGKMVTVETRDAAGPGDNGLTFIDGSKMTDWDTNPDKFYYDANAKKTVVEVMTPVEEVPDYVKTYAGTLHQFPVTESGTIIVTVKSGNTAITDASVTANGLNFRNNNDGTYTATAQLGSEYVITASKEGYSNARITSDVLINDGDTFSATLDMPVDYDGLAIVQLIGGSEKTPVIGATVTLNNGDVLKDMGNGTYQSEKQYAVGNYTVTVSNTGDYIAPSTAQALVIKTTDASTTIQLDKHQGQVSVTLLPVAGEEQTLNTANAVITVGNTTLTNAGNNTFTGMIDVNTPLPVVVSVPGWNTVSVSPEILTATVNNTASATAQLSFKGQLFTWNYTEDTNTDDFFQLGTLANWSSASKNPVIFEGEELTKAVKVNSSFSVTFVAPTDGTLTIVSDAKSGSSVYLNDVSYDLSTQILDIPVKAGTNVLKKNKTESHIYLLQFAGNNEIVPPASTETTTETTTDSTETSTETTTETTTSETLSDEFVWDIENNLSDTVNGLTFGETFYANADEAARDFVDGDKTYSMINFVQGKANPQNVDGINPQGALSTSKIPVSGCYIKFVPEKNGTFTLAAKTNGGKTSYVTDGVGNVLTSIGDENADTSYDIIRTQVAAGETYYVYSGGSKICFYYIGFTSVGDIPPVENFIYGDATADGKVTATDSATVLQKVLNNSFVMPIEEKTNNFLKYIDVSGNGSIDSEDASSILQKALISTFKFEIEA